MTDEVYQLSKSFMLSEFLYSDKALELDIDNEIAEGEHLENLRLLCVELLQPLRNALGVGLYISSGFRCAALNEAVGGVSTSQHTTGQAADVYCRRQFAPIDIARMVVALRLPFDQLILYPTFVHLSLTDGDNRGQILYNKSYQGPKI